MKSNRPAFTLIEVVFSLLVTALCVVAISEVCQACKQLTARPREIMAQHSDIYYSKLQFEKFLRGYRYCRVDQKASSAEAFYFTLQNKARPDKKQDANYQLQVYKDMIRMTNSAGRGHLPLLLGVKKAVFKQQGRLLVIKANQKAGVTDLVCQLPPPPPKEKKDEKKRKQNETDKKTKGQRTVVQHAAFADMSAAR